MKLNKTIYMNRINTLLGPMLSVSSEKYVYFCEFEDTPRREDKLLELKRLLDADIVEGENSINKKLREQMELYFSGSLFRFTIPIKLIGTDFQKKVWKELVDIAYGETISYKELASRVGNKKAYRAVGNANGANIIPIIVPCHRVINSNGNIGGFSAGVYRKKWLLEHERKIKRSGHVRR
ncbi:MAG: hypothetical protein CSB16_00255 [Clostridiales bacterium]|nr:MAG: hypothetical protein CSB16_00255 [Clostridiales bacterium]